MKQINYKNKDNRNTYFLFQQNEYFAQLSRKNGQKAVQSQFEKKMLEIPKNQSLKKISQFDELLLFFRAAKFEDKKQKMSVIKIQERSSSQHRIEPSDGPKKASFKKWTKEENKIYAEFLAENKGEFIEGKERRTLYFFNRMAKALGIGKDNLQCRSHHQKMLFRFKTVEGIIQGILGVKPQPASKEEEQPQPIRIPREEQAPAPYFTPYFWFFLPQ